MYGKIPLGRKDSVIKFGLGIFSGQIILLPLEFTLYSLQSVIDRLDAIYELANKNTHNYKVILAKIFIELVVAPLL